MSQLKESNLQTYPNSEIRRDVVNTINLSTLIDFAKNNATTKELSSIDFLEYEVESYIHALEYEYSNNENTDLTSNKEVASDEWIQANYRRLNNGN
ncbi:hypothetical protein CVPH_0516 [Abyssogena phaseoliformis symbiont OG214]|uniref:hypothetical protein n=1 Tax=Abyssogena phaseoliformis symbiont TaxID=596095 RepID=UPI001915CE35|nr:hypothetical protein [Abyssogena phaseoliformis symbiont]MBW5288854.1 hypothetical protein [Candidatus Ruthia sp. Apha_13_S6]BBB22578.1 hypothetical protein CVPH_0516 [Abyssogena phaseoliformis symbiont OG214]